MRSLVLNDLVFNSLVLKQWALFWNKELSADTRRHAFRFHVQQILKCASVQGDLFMPEPLHACPFCVLVAFYDRWAGPIVACISPVKTSRLLPRKIWSPGGPDRCVHTCIPTDLFCKLSGLFRPLGGPDRCIHISAWQGKGAFGGDEVCQDTKRFWKVCRVHEANTSLVSADRDLYSYCRDLCSYFFMLSACQCCDSSKLRCHFDVCFGRAVRLTCLNWKCRRGVVRCHALWSFDCRVHLLCLTKVLRVCPGQCQLSFGSSPQRP